MPSQSQKYLQSLWNDYINFKAHSNHFVDSQNVRQFIALFKNKLASFFKACNVVASGVVVSSGSEQAELLKSLSGALSGLPFADYINRSLEAAAAAADKQLESSRMNIAKALNLLFTDEDFTGLSEFIAYRIAYAMQDQLPLIQFDPELTWVDDIFTQYRHNLETVGIVLPPNYDKREQMSAVIEQLFQAFFMPAEKSRLSVSTQLKTNHDILDSKGKVRQWTVSGLMAGTGILIDNGDGTACCYHIPGQTKTEKYRYRVLTKAQADLYPTKEHISTIDVRGQVPLSLYNESIQKPVFDFANRAFATDEQGDKPSPTEMAELEESIAHYREHFAILEHQIATNPIHHDFNHNANWQRHLKNKATILDTTNLDSDDMVKNRMLRVERERKDLAAVELELQTQQYLHDGTLPAACDETTRSRIQLLALKLEQAELSDFALSVFGVLDNETIGQLKLNSDQIIQKKLTSDASTLKHKGFFSSKFHLSKASECPRNKFDAAKIRHSMNAHHRYAVEMITRDNVDAIKADTTATKAKIDNKKRQPLKEEIQLYLALGGKLTAGIIANSNHSNVPNFMMKFFGGFIKTFKGLLAKPIQNALELDLKNEKELEQYLSENFEPEQGRYMMEYWRQANLNLIQSSPKRAAKQLLSMRRDNPEQAAHIQGIVDQLLPHFPSSQQAELEQHFASHAIYARP